MSKDKFMFSSIPEVEEFQVLLLLVDWIQATPELSPNCESSMQELDELPSN